MDKRITTEVRSVNTKMDEVDKRLTTEIVSLRDNIHDLRDSRNMAQRLTILEGKVKGLMREKKLVSTI